MTMFEIVAMGTQVVIHLRWFPGSTLWRRWILTRHEFLDIPWLHYQTKMLRGAFSGRDGMP